MKKAMLELGNASGNLAGCGLACVVPADTLMLFGLTTVGSSR
jgi:hypothetical protein